MLQYIRKVKEYKRGEDNGIAATEYVLLLAGIAALIIAAIFIFGGWLGSKFSKTSSCIDKGASAGTNCVTTGS